MREDNAAVTPLIDPLRFAELAEAAQVAGDRWRTANEALDAADKERTESERAYYEARQTFYRYVREFAGEAAW